MKHTTAQDILEALIDNMEQGAEVMFTRAIVPNVYDVYLHHDDYARLRGIVTAVSEEAALALDGKLQQLNKGSVKGGSFWKFGKMPEGTSPARKYQRIGNQWHVAIYDASLYDQSKRDVNQGDVRVDAYFRLAQESEAPEGLETRVVTTVRSNGASHVVESDTDEGEAASLQPEAKEEYAAEGAGDGSPATNAAGASPEEIVQISTGTAEQPVWMKHLSDSDEPRKIRIKPVEQSDADAPSDEHWTDLLTGAAAGGALAGAAAIGASDSDEEELSPEQEFLSSETHVDATDELQDTSEAQPEEIESEEAEEVEAIEAEVEEEIEAVEAEIEEVEEVEVVEAEVEEEIEAVEAEIEEVEEVEVVEAEVEEEFEAAVEEDVDVVQETVAEIDQNEDVDKPEEVIADSIAETLKAEEPVDQSVEEIFEVDPEGGVDAIASEVMDGAEDLGKQVEPVPIEMSGNAAVAVARTVSAKESAASGAAVAKLTYTTREGDRVYYMRDPQIVVGRGGRNVPVDVKLEGLRNVSRKHFVIRHDEDKNEFHIKDLGRFGTKVNGRTLLTSKNAAVPDEEQWYLLGNRSRISLSDSLTVIFETL